MNSLYLLKIDPPEWFKYSRSCSLDIIKMNQKDFTVKEFGTVSQSKKEDYDVLTVDGGYSLPLIEQANADYISDILSGDKMKFSFLFHKFR